MNDLRKKNFKAIKNEWKKMISGQPVDKEQLSPIVYESWHRSMQAGVNPLDINKEILLTEEEIKYFSDSAETEVQGDIVVALKEIACEMEMSFLLYDSDGKIRKVLAIAKNVKLPVPRDISENIIGTNAICLALQHDTPIQLLGEEHFIQTLQQNICTAAPIHAPDGKVIGVINIDGFSIQRHTLETLGFVMSIAKLIENSIRINRMLVDLNASNITLNKIIDYHPSSMVYIDDENKTSYNRAFLNLLEIKETTNHQSVLEKIQKFLSQIDAYKDKKEIEDKEMVLKANNKQKSYMVSMRKILINDNQEKGCLFRFVDANKYLSINLKRSSAVYRFEDIIGESEEIKKVKKLAIRAARTSSAILINGESGTGKELLAQAIHNESFRKDKPFIAINCGAIPSELIESELFGYEPGAFTGASKGIKLGKLEVASGGTFFFDEVESMPLNVQVKLLRALSANKITRIGGVEEIPIDIRIIAATKKDLLLEAEKGNFREDLYFRINIISLNLPPLRERKDDILLLAKSFIKYYEKQANLQEIEVEPEFMEALTYYFWRGNVRELRNVMEKATLLNDDMKLTINNLPPKIVDAYKYKSLKEKVDNKINDIKMNKNILQTSEEMIIELVLNEEKWNLTKAAKRLGISRPTLYKKIEEHPRLKKRKDTLQLFRDVK